MPRIKAKIHHCITCGDVCKRKRKYCSKCPTRFLNPKGWKIASATKASLKERYPNSWNKQRVPVTKHARTILQVSNRIKECHICSYSTYVECCHVKDVSTYADDIPISIINAESNLIYLCPNHHKEFDKGLMSEANLNKIIAR